MMNEFFIMCMIITIIISLIVGGVGWYLLAKVKQDELDE